jgi:hypothetical protein
VSRYYSKLENPKDFVIKSIMATFSPNFLTRRYSTTHITKRRRLTCHASPDTSIISLKEWAPVIAALKSGQQTILMRKGGIREPRFTPASQNFLLLPTSFHTDAHLLKPEARLAYQHELQIEPKHLPSITFDLYAAVTGCWTTFQADQLLHLLDPLHIWTPEFLDKRLRWRSDQPITLMELRVSVIEDDPVQLVPREEWWGCFSWANVDIKEEVIAAKRKIPVLKDNEWAEKQSFLRDQLEKIDVEELYITLSIT